MLVLVLVLVVLVLLDVLFLDPELFGPDAAPRLVT